MKLLLINLLLLSTYAYTEDTYYHASEYETVSDFEKAKAEYMKKKPNADVCNSTMRISYSQTRLQNAKNADAFNKRATKCINSLKSETGYKCLMADLVYFRAFRICKIHYQNNKNNKALSKTPLEIRKECLDSAEKVKNNTLQANECKNYEGIRDIEAYTAPLKYTYDLTISGKSEPLTLDFTTADQTLSSVNQVKQKFYKCYRQAWFDTKKESYNLDTYSKTRACYNVKSLGKCSYNKVRNRFRCVYNNSLLTRLHPTGSMSVVIDKIDTEKKKMAKKYYGKAFDYADVTKTSENYFPLYDDQNNNIENSAGKITFTLDTDAKFVSGEIKYYIFDDSNADYIAAYDQELKLKWMNNNQGQISWLKTGPKLKKLITDLLSKDKGSVAWEYTRENSQLYIEILGSAATNRKLITEKYLLQPYTIEGYPGGIEMSGENIISISSTASNTEKGTSNQVVTTEEITNSNETEVKSTTSTFTEFAPALSPIQIAEFSPAAKKAVIVDQDCGQSGMNVSLETYHTKKELLLEKLNSVMEKYKCSTNVNSGCNTQEVLDAMLGYRKKYEYLSKQIATWEEITNVNNPQTCTGLYFNKLDL